MYLADAHNHFQNYPPEKLDNAMTRFRAAGGRTMLVNSADRTDWAKVASLADRFPDVIVPCFGIHPWFASGLTPDWENELRRYVLKYPVSCIGETGIDKLRPDLKLQLDTFRKQIKIAEEFKRPIIIHCVKAFEPLIQELRHVKTRFMVHSFGGSVQTMKTLKNLGGYFSFSGAVAKPERKRMRDTLLNAPPDRVLFETDTPSDAPFQEEPLSVREVMAKAAEITGGTECEILSAAWANLGSFLAAPETKQ